MIRGVAILQKPKECNNKNKSKTKLEEDPKSTYLKKTN